MKEILVRMERYYINYDKGDAKRAAVVAAMTRPYQRQDDLHIGRQQLLLQNR